MTAPAAANQSQKELWNNLVFLNRWQDANEKATRAALRHLLSAAELRPGERVVDVACGAGLPTLSAATAVGKRGVALGVDISAELLEKARQRASEAGATNTTFAVLDAQEDPYPGSPYDIAISRNGLMFLDDPAAAFANLRRALRTGGRLVFTCFHEDDNRSYFDLVRGFAPGLDASDREGMYRLFGYTWLAHSLGNTSETRALLAKCGFGSIRHRSFHHVSSLPPSRMASPAVVDRLPPAGRDAAMLALLDWERARTTTNGQVRMKRHCLLFTAVAI